MFETAIVGFRKDEFLERMLSQMKDLKCDRDFLDVTLVSDYYQISAHKVVLASSSAVFKNLLKNSPHHHPYIYIYGVRSCDLQNLVEFMYCGEVTINKDRVATFMTIAQNFKVIGLSQIKHSLADETNLELPSLPGAQGNFGRQEQSAAPQEPASRDTRESHTDSDIREDNDVEGLNSDPSAQQTTYEDNDVTNNQESIYPPQSSNTPNTELNTTKKAVTSESVIEKTDVMAEKDSKMVLQTNEQANHFSCETCGIIVKRKANLLRHIREKHEHSALEVEKCELCDTSFTRKADLIRHKKKHNCRENSSLPGSKSTFKQNKSEANKIPTSRTKQTKVKLPNKKKQQGVCNKSELEKMIEVEEGLSDPSPYELARLDNLKDRFELLRKHADNDGEVQTGESEWRLPGVHLDQNSEGQGVI